MVSSIVGSKIKSIAKSKYTPYVLGGIVLIVGGIIIVKKIKNRDPRVKTKGADLSNAEAKIVANNQFGYMNKLGTEDIDTMVEGLKSLNEGDLRKVYNAFGTKCYNGYTECVGIDKWLGGRDLDLFGWYVEELDDEELDKMRDVWSKSNLPITF